MIDQEEFSVAELHAVMGRWLSTQLDCTPAQMNRSVTWRRSDGWWEPYGQGGWWDMAGESSSQTLGRAAVEIEEIARALDPCTPRGVLVGSFPGIPEVIAGYVRQSLWWHWTTWAYWAYLDSPWWRRQRESAFELYGDRCLTHSGRATQVHHASYANVWSARELADLRPMCAGCHAAISRYGPKPVDPEGPRYREPGPRPAERRLFTRVVGRWYDGIRRDPPRSEG